MRFVTAYIYKLLRAGEWDTLRQSGKLDGSPDDLRDGFIHFSAVDQLKTTFDKYFSDVHNPTLVAVDPAGLGPALKWEISRGGKAFPHLYRALLITEVHASFAIRKDVDGRPIFPPEIVETKSNKE